MSSSKRDYYEVLGVARDADEATLKKSYRRLAMDLHPDRRPGDKEAEERFKEAAEAYGVLSDPEKRKLYDRFGHQGPQQSGFSGFGGIEDIFSAFQDIFGGMGGGGFPGFGGRRVPRGDDLEVEMEISFMDAVKGCQREIEIERHVSCEKCDGTGAKPGTKPQTCKTCQGRGQVAHQQGFFVISTTCPQCRGQRVTISEKCPSCRGAGQVPKKATVNVSIPPGIDDGQRLRLSRKGNPSPTAGGEEGDLYVLVRVQPDSRFVRDGDNLWVDVPLTFAEAALGARVQIATPDGPETVEVAAGTQPMTKQVLPNRGMPNVRGRGRGDLVLRYIVKVPTSLSGEARELVEKLSCHLGTPPSSSSGCRGKGASVDGHDSHDGEEEESQGSLLDRMFGGGKKKKKS